MGTDYLEGNYAPMRREHSITEVTLTGIISAHLNGRYLRYGPNPSLRSTRKSITAGRVGCWALISTCSATPAALWLSSDRRCTVRTAVVPTTTSESYPEQLREQQHFLFVLRQ